jgi:hypothetical protein
MISGLRPVKIIVPASMASVRSIALRIVMAGKFRMADSSKSTEGTILIKRLVRAAVLI